MRKLLTAGLALLPIRVLAAVLTTSWTNPTVSTDGSALAVTSITQTRVEYGSCTGSGATLAFGVKAGEFIALGGKTQQATPNLTPGTYCFRAYTTANGSESAPSNVAQASVGLPVPAPPSGLTTN